jgi:hypothetical protein
MACVRRSLSAVAPGVTNSTNENINWRHLINVTWVSKPLATPKVIPSDEELFGADLIAKLK